MLAVIAILLGLILLAVINRKAATWTVIAGLGCTYFLFLLGLGAGIGIITAQAIRFEWNAPVLGGVVGVGVALVTITYGLRGANWLFEVLFPDTVGKARERAIGRERLRDMFG